MAPRTAAAVDPVGAVRVGVRSGEAARRTAAGGSQRAPSRAQDSHRARGGGRAGAQGPQPLGFAEPFRSLVVPPYVRRCASLDAAIAWLYLHGVSTGQMRQAVGALVGEEAARGLSANVVSRLKRSWDEEYRQWRRRRLHDEWVYLSVDGIYSALRSERERLCVLVVIGVNARGEKHFLVIEEGVRKSTQSWREVLLGMKQRGFTRPAKLAVGDGALGFWAALSQVYPTTRTQRCWIHKTGNVLNYLPKSGQAKAKQGLHEIWMAETKAQADRAFDDWLQRYDDKYPKATACLARDRDELLAFYDFPAAHWTHLRTTNVIESAFATIRQPSAERNRSMVPKESAREPIRGAGCLSWACPDLWEPRVGNRPRPPGQ